MCQKLKYIPMQRRLKCLWMENLPGCGVPRRKNGGATIFTWENIELLQDKENTVKAIAVFCDGSQKEDCVTWIGR